MKPPALFDYRRSAAMTFLALPLGLRAERLYQNLPRISSIDILQRLPSLSIIIPARNEEANLSVLLPSLCSLRYPGPLEILVVDDQSTDQTAAVAQAHGAGLLRLDHLPSGWLGKPFACHQGAQAAQGEWLLFTDADTVHAPDGPAQAVAYALQERLDGLSCFLQQDCQLWGDRLALAAAFAGLFSGYQQDKPHFNGQYILLKREAYLGSAGFSAVRNIFLEDLALGDRLRHIGYRVPILRGEDLASVRMYPDSHHLFQGLSRLGVGALHWSGASSLLTILFISAVMSPLIVLVGVLRGKMRFRWLAITWCASSLSMLPWSKRIASPAWALLAPLGALLVQIAAIYGLLARLFGRGLTWKERKV